MEARGAGLGLRYTDAFGITYVLKAGAHGMRIFEGANHLPNWELVGMPYLWQVEANDHVANGSRWGECAPGEQPGPISFADQTAAGSDPNYFPRIN